MSDFEEGKENTPTYLSSSASQRRQLLLHHFPLYISSPLSLFLFLCVYLFFSAYSGFISLSLLFLVVIFTKCLVKGPACPQVWIRFTQGLGLCLVLFALTGVRSVRARKGISYKTAQFGGQRIFEMEGLGNSLQDTSPFLLSLCKSVSPTSVNAVHKKKCNIPMTCDS